MGKEKKEATGEDVSKIQTKEERSEQGLLPASDGKPSDVEDDSNGENEIEWKVAHDKKLCKDLILGGQKKEGNKDKSSKKSQPQEGPSSSEPDNERPMNEQEETNAKRNSTRSGRRKRRNGDLKMSTKRKLAYGIMKPKRPKNH
ncbi:unnamed protein product [Urochloa humidicola]